MPYAQPKPVDNTTAELITRQVVRQLQTSRTYKRARMTQIMENENLYMGLIEKTLRNPFNENTGYMSGYIDHLKSKIDDDSTLLYSHEAEADLKRANKINSFYKMVSESIESNDSWNIKHRHAKINAMFSGMAIYHYYATKSPEYRSNLEVVSHYDFHFEPRGGAILENHLFCGQDSIFKNKEDLIGNATYNQEQVAKLIADYQKHDYKDNKDQEDIRNNRARALGLDPVTNNYVGQDTIKFAQFYTTFKGKRYYVLFNEMTSTWIRCCPIEEIFPDGLYPYIIWHTNEDPDLMLSKAPADDARPIAKIINTMVNQELYNRQKRNYGVRGYDVDMFPNVKALADWRPDGLVPVNTFGGQRRIDSGVFEFKVGDLNGTLELVTWLESFNGKQIGYTASSAGQSQSDKKVGVFQGEVQQVEQLIGIKNKSYRDALSRLGLLFKQGLDHNMTKPVAIKVMGATGIEWDELTPKDLKTEKSLSIKPIGGTSELQLKKVQDQQKKAILETLQAVNPQWKERQLLLLSGFNEDDIKDAFSSDTFAKKELMSEASQAEKDIVEGKDVPMNRGADSNFIEHITNFATDTQELPMETYKKLMDYAFAHVDIAVENEVRDIKGMIRKKKMQMLGQNPTSPQPNQPPAPAPMVQ